MFCFKRSRRKGRRRRERKKRGRRRERRKRGRKMMMMKLLLLLLPSNMSNLVRPCLKIKSNRSAGGYNLVTGQ